MKTAGFGVGETQPRGLPRGHFGIRNLAGGPQRKRLILREQAQGRRMDRMSDDWIHPTKREPFTGGESLDGIEATIKDFWAFAMSDLRANNVRGYFAEFLVARAVGASGPRIEWDAYDVLTPDGIRVEVKSSGRSLCVRLR